jgi:hypothetical protein
MVMSTKPMSMTDTRPLVAILLLSALVGCYPAPSLSGSDDVGSDRPDEGTGDSTVVPDTAVADGADVDSVSDTTPPDSPTVAIVEGQFFNIASDTNNGEVGIQITLSGTSEQGSAITIFQNPTYETTSTQAGEWSQEITLIEGTNAFSIRAQDQAGNTSTSTILTIYLDSVAPTTTIAKANYAVDSDTFEIQWASAAEDFESYQVQYKIGTESDWQDLATSTTATSLGYSEAAEGFHYFRVRTRDIHQISESGPNFQRTLTSPLL